MNLWHVHNLICLTLSFGWYQRTQGTISEDDLKFWQL